MRGIPGAVSLKSLLSSVDLTSVECWEDDELKGSRIGELRDNGTKLCLSPAMWKLLESHADRELMIRTLKVVRVEQAQEEMIAR
jgi:hypothetical protein